VARSARPGRVTGSHAQRRRDIASRTKTEVLLALELLALASFAFSRPILSVFGDTPQLFVSRDASRADVVGFALVVTLVPATVLALVGMASGVFGARPRRVTHVVLVAACAGLGFWRAFHDPTGGRTWVLPALAVGAAGAVVVGVLRSHRRTRETTARFLRVASIGAGVFALQFLVVSPVATTLVAPAAAVDERITSQAVQDLGPDPPPVVMVVLDELPTSSLLDGEGDIDGDLYPAFAALASDATWYRNHTTVAAHTVDALPALLTGRYPPPAESSMRSDPENLFSLLAGTHDLAVEEPVTRLCTDALCPHESPSSVRELATDAAGWWAGGLTWEMAENMAVPALPGSTGPGRYERARETIDGLDLGGGERPPFAFLHFVLPHGPWEYTEDGSLYARPDGTRGVVAHRWTDAGMELGRQRHILQVQATDALLGRLLDALQRAGVYDDALIVVTADHGVTFTPGRPTREVVAGTEHDILWTPLLVKAPGQAEPEVVDDNVVIIDVLPTIADVLGLRIPWDVDGRPTGSSPRPEATKPLIDGYVPAGADEPLRPVDGRAHVDIEVGDLFEQVLAGEAARASGPDAAWRTTEYGDVFGEEVAAVAHGPADDSTVRIQWPAGFDDIDTDEPLPLEILASTSAPAGTVVAFALNGTIGSLGEVQDSYQDGGRLVQGLLPPTLFEDGANELEAFAVTGDPAAPTLHALGVEL
jgi:hypothetical protein